jgi:hypothetical protein
MDLLARLRRPPSLAGVVGTVIVLAGLFVGLSPLDDNSFFTHLATGRLILSGHSIPTHDPYSFTAPGHAWVVQSWLASVLYAGAERAAGAAGVVLLVGLSAMALAAIVWVLTRPAEMVTGRLAVAAVVIAVGAGSWVERPLLFGLLALGLTLLAAEGRIDPRWLVPAYWFWTNVHGSFPLGLLALALLATGRRLDGGSPSIELRALRWAVLGTLLGVVGPLGLHVLTFPVELLRRQNVLHDVLEWQAPRFEVAGQRAFLLEIALVIVALTRRPTWRLALPAAIFIPAALLGARNVVVASLVLAPGLALGAAGLGTIRGDERKPVFRVAMVTLVVLGLLASAGRLGGQTVRLRPYPVAAVTWAEQHAALGVDARVVTQDFVGNYLEVRLGTAVRTFIDDRYDMFPTEVVDDYTTLLKAGPGWQDVLRRWSATSVLWERRQPLAELLIVSPAWHVVYSDELYVIAQPR